MEVVQELEYIGLFSMAARQLHRLEAGPARHWSVPSGGRVLHRGDHLFRSGDRSQSVYRVIGGVLKSYFIHQNGDEQIMGFYLPGDLIGFDALSGESASFSVVALDTASVMRESQDSVSVDAPFSATLDRQLQACMRMEVFRLARLLRMARSGTDARLACFLLDYSEAQASRGYDRYEFHLPMGRKDLACYIGLVPETVSRVFSRLRDRGILRVENNHICILDHAALKALAVEDQG